MISCEEIRPCARPRATWWLRSNTKIRCQRSAHTRVASLVTSSERESIPRTYAPSHVIQMSCILYTTSTGSPVPTHLLDNQAPFGVPCTELPPSSCVPLLPSGLPCRPSMLDVARQPFIERMLDLPPGSKAEEIAEREGLAHDAAWRRITSHAVHIG